MLIQALTAVLLLGTCYKLISSLIKYSSINHIVQNMDSCWVFTKVMGKISLLLQIVQSCNMYMTYGSLVVLHSGICFLQDLTILSNNIFLNYYI